MPEGKPSVLIVDDQTTWLRLFSDLLEDEYEVTCATSYDEALSALTQDVSFQVAVVDIRLDDKDSANEDGLRLIELINQRKANTRTIVVTGYPTIRTTRQAFRDLKAFDYFEKYPENGRGFDIKAFRQAVSDAAKSFGDSNRTLLAHDASSTGADKPRSVGALFLVTKLVRSIVQTTTAKGERLARAAFTS